MAKSKSRTLSTSSTGTIKSDRWVHVTTNSTLAWLIISIPLVIWDTGFVLLRPYSMPGGSLHWPIWTPYELYTRTDYVYGWKAITENNGFTAAQGSMNIPETLLYIYYLYLVSFHGTQVEPRLLARRYIAGTPGALASIIGFTAAVMTFSKTILYGLNEAFSGWSNVGHNDWVSLIFLWIIPNGAWLVGSALMSFTFGGDILQGLSLAAGEREKSPIKVE